jgi:SAM-dependent methyltransferase
MTTPTSPAVRRYFADRYPDRQRAAARWFRAGEAARHDVIAPWLRGVAGLRVLDVGAGDGAFLAAALTDRPAEIHVVDLTPAVEVAARRLRRHADRIVAHVGDVHALALPPADVVVSFGVTDYHVDWPALLGRLRALATRRLIVDFPRAGAARNLARRAWLGVHGVALHTGARPEVAAVTAPLGPVELVATRLHWIARVAARDATGDAR